MANNLFHDSGRLSAHVLIDAVMAYEPDDDSRSVDLAFQRLSEVEGAIEATFDDETDHLTLDLSGLLGGALIAIHRLVEEVSLARGIDREIVGAMVREYVDQER